MYQVSIVGKQIGNELHPYYTESGRHILALSEGRASISTLLASERLRITECTKFIRLQGFLFVYIGSSALIQLAEYLGKMCVYCCMLDINII